MATIERTNALLVDERMRVVLITASSSLFGAAERVPVLSSQDGEAFAEVCLRHPQAFLGDNSFFAASQKPQRGEYGGTFRVFDWLNLILPSYIYKGDKHAVVRSKDLLKDLRTTQRDFPPAARERLDTMSSEWMQQVRLAAVSRGLSEGFYEPTPRAAVLVKELKRKAAKGITAARLLQEVSAAAMRSIAEMYGSTMYLQWLELRNEVGRVVGVPALRFDEPYPAAQAICDRIQEAMFDQPPPMFDISSLYREFKNIDKENYHAFVIHALVFAIRGHWFGTKTLCLLAISVVESIPKEQRKMRTGREAAYLLAVAERRLATRLKDLDRSLEYLQMARERENKGALPDPRFAAESLANDVARLNLRISESPDRSEASAEAVSSLRDVLNRAEGILKRMRQNELGKVRAWVRRQVTTNVINVALLAECYSAGATRGYEASLRALLSALKRAKLAPEPASERRFQDALSDTLYWAGLAVFGDDPDARRAAAHELGQVGPRVVGVDPERIKAFCALGIARATGG